METDEKTPGTPRRRLLRFSLRTLLIVMTVLAVSLGLYIKSFRDHRTAIIAMEKLGGAISLKYHGPEWLRKRISDDKYFWNPLAVRFQPEDPLTDEELEGAMPYLHSFHDLYYLNFRGSQITNDGLKHLLPLADKLRVLDITNTAISDEGVAQLKQLPHLENIRLKGSAITPAGIDELKQALPNCTFDW